MSGAKARVGDDDVDRTERALDLLNRGMKRLAVAHVGGRDMRFSSTRLDLAGQVFERLSLPGHQSDLVAAAGQFEGQSAANPARRAGHHCYRLRTGILG